MSDQRDRKRRLEDAVAALPEHHREVILLRDYQGMTWAEIADATGRASPDAARMAHNAAVIREKKGGERWAVDSWPRGNGGPPDILPLSEWMAAS